MDRILKIIDANQNRAKEGLRVAEEVCRFVVEDETLTRKIKGLRHRLCHLVDRFYGVNILREREIERDAGRGLNKIGFEGGYIGVVRANLSRVQEALRTIEEFSKLTHKEAGSCFNELRFEVYGVEKELCNALACFDYRERMRGLYAIIDLGLLGDGYREFTKGVIEGGATIIQLRGKGVNIRRLIDIGLEIKGLARREGVIFIVNDRVDVAIGIDADGVHLGQEDTPVWLARKLIGYDKIIGISTHNLEEVKRAVIDGVNYISFGPIYKTPTKPDLSPVGPEPLKEIRDLTTIPIFAIGGITKENLHPLMESGVDGVVCASYLVGAKSLVEATQELSERFKKRVE